MYRGREAPEHRMCSVRVPNCSSHIIHVLHSLRRDVVIGGQFKRKSVNVTESEGFGDALLIGSALVTATHRPDSIAVGGCRQQGRCERDGNRPRVNLLVAREKMMPGLKVPHSWPMLGGRGSIPAC